MITFVLGGAASGKSSFAEAIVMVDDAVYVATGVASDDDMAARIEAHRTRRPATWSTVETIDVAGAVRGHAGRTLLIDSLTTWVAASPDFGVDVDDLVKALAAHEGDAFVVSDEVGLGVHPETEVGRRFRDALGRVNQGVAAVADRTLLVVAGRAIEVP
jgi:adenosyl cobinamide kinase/adenosyl cobinamide phosphate guanylyltransferase